MSPYLPSVLAAGLLAMAAFPGLAAPGGSDPLAPYRWKARLLVVVAPAAADANLLRQRELFSSFSAGARERDLTLVEAIGNEPRAVALRKQLGLADGRFQAVLVGKDGGSKLVSDEPLGSDQLFPLIDSMPMRKDEMSGK